MKHLLLVLVGLVGLLLGANVIIDPFYRFDLVSIPGFNAQRSVFAYQGRMGKAENICRVRPEQIAIGGSKIEVAIDPRSPAWGRGSVYDMGLAGMPLSEMYQTLMFVARVSQLKRAVVGLDFMQFNQLREDVVYKTEVVDFNADRISGSCAHAFLHDWNLLIGPQAAKFALHTIRSQRRETGGWKGIGRILPDGDLTTGGYFAILFDDLGYRSKFPIAYEPHIDGFGGWGQEEYYVEKIWRPGPKHTYQFGGTFEVFRTMLRFARTHDIDMRLFTEPLHARMLLAIQDAGLWPQFEEWKRRISEIAAEEGFPLYDFEAFSPITEDQGYWWEPSHYRKSAGDMLLRRVLGGDASFGFGALLTPDNIEGYLAAQDYAAKAYEERKPEAAAGVAAIVKTAMAKAPSS